MGEHAVIQVEHLAHDQLEELLLNAAFIDSLLALQVGSARLS